MLVYFKHFLLRRQSTTAFTSSSRYTNQIFDHKWKQAFDNTVCFQWLQPHLDDSVIDVSCICLYFPYLCVFRCCSILGWRIWLHTEVHTSNMSNCVLLGLFISMFIFVFLFKTFTKKVPNYPLSHWIAIEVFVFVLWLSLSHSCLTISTPPLVENGGKSTNGWYEKD